MKSADNSLIHNIIVYVTILSFGFLFIGCSSEKDEQTQDEVTEKSAASEVSSQEQRPTIPNQEIKQPMQKNDKLKEATVKTISDKKQVATNDTKQKQKAAKIAAELATAIDTERKLELIESLEELSIEQDPSVIIVVQQALEDSDPEVGRAAIELLEDYETPEILPVVVQALKSDDEQIREYALLPLSGIKDPHVSELLVLALDDTSEDVRATALDVTEELEGNIQLDVMEKGIISAYADVKEATISMLEYRANHSAVEILILGLSDSDSHFKELINETLDFLIDKQFESYQEAKSWWNANKNNYDEELFRIEDE